MSSQLFRTLFKTLAIVFSGGFCLLHSGTAAAYEPLRLEMVAVYEKHSLWTSWDVEQMLFKANKVLAQCSIYIVKAKDIPTEHENIPMGYETAPLSNVYYISEQKPVLLLINGVDYKQSAGLSPGDSAVYLSIYSRSEEYKNAHSPDYDVLAHELGHMLGGLKHIAATDEKNLMAAYIDRQSSALTPEQCEKMRAHKDLKSSHSELHF